MLEVYLKTPGVIFSKPNGENVRTPIKFLVNDNEELLYRNLIKVSAIKDFEISKTDKLPKPIVKGQRLSLIKPSGSDINLSLKIQG